MSRKRISLADIENAYERLCSGERDCKIDDHAWAWSPKWDGLRCLTCGEDHDNKEIN